jgi:type IV secretory pathway VirB2 component (pilin)
MKKYLPVLFVVLFFLFSAHSVSAYSVCGGPIVPCGGAESAEDGGGQPRCEFCHLFVMFNNMVKFLLFCIVPPIAVAGIVLAGIIMIFSQGNPTVYKSAVDVIKAVFIGLFIVFTAWILINTFFTFIKFADTVPLQKGWFEIRCE